MKSKYFKIHELVPEHIFINKGEKAWRYIDDRLISSIDMLKKHFSSGTITINNYNWGGNFQWSGLRTPDSSHYNETSLHSMGRAADMKFSDYTADEVRLYILSNKGFFPYIKGLEDTVSWVHIDTRNEDSLVLFKP